MAIEAERLIVTLEARLNKYERELKRAAGTTNRQFTRIERRGKAMESRMSRLGAGIGRSFIAAFAGGAALRGMQQLLDASVRIDNALKVAGLSGAELEKVYNKLFESAQRNAAPMESLVQLYGRAALVQKELGISTEELLGFTDKVAVALRVSGQSAQESRGALLQLSQALGSGIVRAEEFNSILEGALPIAQAAAAGLEEAGGSVAKLRQLVVDGQISSEAFFRAFEAGSVILEEKVESVGITASQGFTLLRNALLDTVRDLNKTTGASEKMGGSLDRMAIAVNELGGFLDRVANGPLGTFASAIGTADEIARQFVETLKGLTLADEVFDVIGNFVAPDQQLTEQAIKDYAARHGLGTDRVVQEGKGPRRPATVRPVSLADFIAPDSGKTGSTGRRGGSRGGGGSSSDSFQREIEQIRQRTAAINAMTQAQAGVNPLIDDYGYAVEKARIEQELLTAAQESGRAITPELRNQIAELADGYASAGVAAHKLAEAQQRVNEQHEHYKDVVRGAIDDLRYALEDGKLEWEELAQVALNALDRIVDKLLNDVIDALFEVNSAASRGGGGGGLFGFIGKLFGGGGGGPLTNLPLGVGLYHSGGIAGQPKSSRAVNPALFAGAPRYHGGGVAGLRPNEVPAILQRGERVIPNGAGGKSVIELRMSRDVEARVLERADNNTSVQIMRMNDALPDRVNEINQHPRRR